MRFLVMLCVLFCGVAVYGQPIPSQCDGPGPTPDCNGNGIDDICDVASGFSLDCNSNLIPDFCDVISGTSLDLNGNGNPDECDGAKHFMRGNVVQGFSTYPTHNMADVLAIINFLQGTGSPPPCWDAMDVNDDGQIDISDPTFLLNYLFGGGPLPPPPWSCGIDLTPDNYLGFGLQLPCVASAFECP